MNLGTFLLVLFTLGLCRSAVLKQRSLASVDPVVDLRLANPYLSRQRRSSFTINSQIGDMASRKSSFQIDVRLFSKTQVFLQIAADGTVNGTLECTSEYAKIQMQSMGREIQRIKGIQTGRYVAMNENGTLYSTTSPNSETLFRETLLSNGFSTFASVKYYRTSLYDSFISIGRNGKARSGVTTNKSQKKVMFLRDHIQC